MSIETENAELLTPRELRRDFARHMERLTSGDVEKLVLLQRNQMVAVVLPFQAFLSLLQPTERNQMQIKIVNDAEGCPLVEVINPEDGSIVQSVELARSQEVTVTTEGTDPSKVEISPVAVAE